MTMTDPLTPETLSDIELDCEDERTITLPSTTVLALVAECRELRRLRGALEFLEGGYRPLRSLIPEQLLEQAKECGWKEGA